MIAKTSIPVHLICGFLGSGKTTLLRRILAEQPPDERLAVMVNEFGEIGIDGELLSGFESEVMELTSGCICCTLKADFITSMATLIKEFTPDRIIVEATGLAETGDLAGAVGELAKREDVALRSVVTVIDADFFTYREMLGPLYFNQIKCADLLLLNKLDLLEDHNVDDLAGELAAINPRARIMPVLHCAVDRSIILSPLSVPNDEAAATAFGAMPLQSILPDLTVTPNEAPAHSADAFRSFALESEKIMGRPCLEALMKNLPWGVFRLKGLVRLPEGMFLLNYTYRRLELSPIDRSEGSTRLAGVAYNMDISEIVTQLHDCLKG